MSVLGSQLEMDLDPEGECVIFNGQRHIGNTGTGCYKLHDTKIKETKKPPNLPLDDKVDATWIYAPTPTPPPEEPDEDDGGLYFPYVSVPFHMLFAFFYQVTKKGQVEITESVVPVSLPQAKILCPSGITATWLS